MHKALRAPVSPLYSFSKLQTLEGVIDDNIDRLFRQLDHTVSGASISLTTWLQAFAFDTVWAWMFTEPYGLLEMGAMEARKILESNWEIFQIIGPVSVPILYIFYPSVSIAMILGSSFLTYE